MRISFLLLVRDTLGRDAELLFQGTQLRCPPVAACAKTVIRTGLLENGRLRLGQILNIATVCGQTGERLDVGSF
jgi:hypothetical protein